MTLRRTNVSAANRVLLPTFPAFFAWVGASLAFSPVASLRKTPVFQFVDDRMPIQVWGWVFLAAAAAMVVALVIHHRNTYQLAIAVAIGVIAWWFILSVGSTLAGEASISAGAWPFGIGSALVAASVSLASREKA